MRGPTGTVLLRCALVAGLLVVPGCSDDPEQPGTLPTRSPSPTPTSTSASPDTPEEQVEAAVRAYYSELTRAAQTNDTQELRQMVTRACPCYRPIRVIESGAKRGEITPDAEWTVTRLRIHDLEPGTALAEVEYEVSAYDVLDESGDVLGHVAAQRSHFDLSLVKSGSEWVISNLVNLEA
jgi:hypothetical protein